MLRTIFLKLSANKTLRHWMESSFAAKRITERFVAGTALNDGLAVAQVLAGRQIQIALDHLGENVSTPGEAREAGRVALASLQALSDLHLNGTIAVKLTQLGLDISVDEAVSNLRPLVELAKRAETRVEIDMESTAYTQRTLDIVRRVHAESGSVRAVIQAYMYRSEADIRQLNLEGIPVRLCKGAYQEPPNYVMQEKESVDRNYVRLMELLLTDGVDPAIATHDPAIIDHALRFVAGQGIAASRFEFEMLYGVRRDLQQMLVNRGFRLRLYVPYGDAWYPYFLRRLAERPANVWFVVRNMFRS